ncbi:MAG: hypothetical protein SGI96_21160 [Bacteroidota bacterium]|nr:hypothetical protein [Bacteroidota bacterium]
MIIPPPKVAEFQAYIETIDSKRMRILEAMRLLLREVKVENGYKTEIMEVSYDVKMWRDKSIGQTPVVYIIDDTSNLVTHAGHIREYVWNIRLFGVIREKTIVEFEEFISDMETAIYDNNTLFGQCNLVRVREISTDNQLFSELDGTHLFEMNAEVLYTRKFDRPK